MSYDVKPCPCIFCEDRRNVEKKIYQWTSLKEYAESDVRVRPTQFEAAAKAVEPKPESFIVAGLKQQRITQRAAYKNASDRIEHLRKKLTEASEQRRAASVKFTELTRAIDKLS